MLLVTAGGWLSPFPITPIHYSIKFENAVICRSIIEGFSLYFYTVSTRHRRSTINYICVVLHARGVHSHREAFLKQVEA